MRNRYLASIAAAAVLTFASSALALEKTQARVSDLPDNAWTAGSTCSVVYFNTCAGYVWLWSGFGDDTELGMQFDNCCPGGAGALDVLQTIHWNGAPSGYGFTGTVNAYDDLNANACPDDGLVYTAPFLPAESGAGAEVVAHAIGGVPVGSSIVASITLALGSVSPVNLPSDQGSQPCVPARTNHSYIWGAAATAICPGSTFVAVTDPCELLWSIGLTCPISVEESSWSTIKGLYR